VAGIHFATCALNIFLDYVLIFGKFGAPALGITGAGFATTISCVFGLLLSASFFLFQNQKEYPTRSSWALNFADIKRLISFGAPTGIEVFFSVAGFAFITFLIGKLGPASLAANTIAVSINMIAFLPLLGMSEATGIVVGKYIGMGDPDISEKAAYRSWKMSTLYMLVMCAFYLIFPDSLFEFFSPAKNNSGFAEVLQYGRGILVCAAILNFFDVTRFIFLGALSGAGDTKAPMFIVIACAWGILAPGGAILILLLKVSIVTVWIFIAFHIFTLSSLIFLRFKSEKWKKIDLIGRKQGSEKKPLPTEFLETEAETPHLR
jgi:MATE family multidrug resistance protein